MVVSLSLSLKTTEWLCCCWIVSSRGCTGTAFEVMARERAVNADKGEKDGLLKGRLALKDLPICASIVWLTIG